MRAGQKEQTQARLRTQLAGPLIFQDSEPGYRGRRVGKCAVHISQVTEGTDSKVPRKPLERNVQRSGVTEFVSGNKTSGGAEGSHLLNKTLAPYCLSAGGLGGQMGVHMLRPRGRDGGWQRAQRGAFPHGVGRGFRMLKVVGSSERDGSPESPQGQGPR
jgi:hypothetical protein